MAEEKKRNIRLGIFITAGTLLLVLAFYLMGSKQNLFGSTIRISARFYEIGGLMKGNNVRFAGIDVGTVESVVIENDTTVRVTMVVEEKSRSFIRKTSVASIGTDGLMGNKLINISPARIPSDPVADGDEILSKRPLEMDAMVRTLDITNENIRVISSNLRNITERINSPNSLWTILLDSSLAHNVKSAVVSFRLISEQGLVATGNLRAISEGMRHGKGIVAALVNDTSLSGKVRQTVVNLKRTSDTTALITGNIAAITRQIRNGQGNLGILLSDTTLIHHLKRTALNADTGTANFNENMEALKHSWPFKKYYRKKKNSKAAK